MYSAVAFYNENIWRKYIQFKSTERPEAAVLVLFIRACNTCPIRLPQLGISVVLVQAIF